MAVSFERIDSKLTSDHLGSTSGTFLSQHWQQAGTEPLREVLLRPIPASPNQGSDTISQGEYSGYPLVATAAGQRVVIFRRDAKLSPVQITRELQGAVLAVSWRKDRGLVNSAPFDTKRSVGLHKNALQGALAAACEQEVMVFLPFKPTRSSTSFSVNFPFQWSRAYRIPTGASAIAWSMSSGALAACSGPNVNLWQIPYMHPPEPTQVDTPEWSFSLHTPPTPPDAISPPSTPLSAAASSSPRKATCVAISPDSVVVACSFADVPQLHFRAVEPPPIDARLSAEEQQTEDEFAEEELQAFARHLPPSLLATAHAKQSPAFGPTSPTSAPAKFSVGSPASASHKHLQGSFAASSSSGLRAEVAARPFGQGAVVDLGGSVLSVKFAKAHHFQKLPGSNVLFALESNGNVKVILCCSQVKRKFMCKATVCAVVKLPPGPDYTVTWGLLPEETGNNLIKTPSMTFGGSAVNASFRLKKAATGPQAKSKSGGDQWWAGLAHHSSGRQSKKSVQVEPQTAEAADTDWLMCIGSDRTMLVYKIEMALRQGDLVLDPKCATFVFRVELDPCGDKAWEECVMGTSANVSNIAGGLEAPARLEGVSNDVQPGVVSLISTATSKDGTRRWMSAWDVNLPTRKATRAAHYASHSDPVVCVSGHGTQPFVASCSETGEAILWLCDFSYAAPAALSHFAVLQGTFGNLAWSPAMSSAEGVWQTGLLWALAHDGSSVQAFCVRPFMWEDQGGILAAVCTLSMGVREEEEEEVATPVSGREQSRESEDQPRHLRVVLESSKEETGEFDKQLVIAVLGGSMHVWRVVICPDEMGCPSVFQSKRLPTYQLPRHAVAIATLDPLDHSWKGEKQNHIVLTGGEHGRVDVSEIQDEVIYRGTFPVDDDAVTVREMTFLTAWELVVLVVDSSGKAQGLVLERMSHGQWRLEGVLPRGFSADAKLSSFLAGDGSALLGVFDQDQVTIFGPVPWSWTDKRGSSLGADPNLRKPDRKFARRWAVIRDVSLERGGFCARGAAELSERAVRGSCMDWCTDGSIVVGSGTRMAVLGAGIYDATSMNAELLAEGRKAWSEARGAPLQPALGHGLSALWTKIDSLRAGASVVYYHPTLIEHSILSGQIGNAAHHLSTLYKAMRQQQEGGNPVGVDCAFESPVRALRPVGQDSSPEVRPQVPGPIEPWKPKGLAAQLEGVDLSGVRKIAVMKVPNETKTKAVSKLVEREERLAVLLSECEGATWDADAKQLLGTPAWTEVLQAIARVEKEREEPTLQWGEEEPPPPDNQREAASASGLPGDQFDDDQILTESEARGLKRLLEECLEQMSGEDEGLPSGAQSPVNGHSADHFDSKARLGITLTGLSLDAVCKLLAFTSAFADLRSGAGASLDLCGTIFFLVTRARLELDDIYARQRSGAGQQNGHANGHSSSNGVQAASGQDLSATVDSTVLCLAKHCEQQEALVDLLCAPGQAAAALQLHPALWLDRDDKLRELAEKVANEQYRKSQKPMDAALMYVLAGRVRVLSNLFRTRDEKAVGDFLLRDFSLEQNQRAACKNAFSLIGKHQPEAAVAFFVLGNNLREAVDLICKNLRRPLLAVLVVRLAQGKEQAVKLVREVVIPAATEHRDRGLLHLAYWYADEFAASYAVLWSLALAKDSVGKKVETKGKLGGLLSRLDDDEEEETQEEAVEMCLEDNIHPCTISLIKIVIATPKMKVAAKILSLPKPPLRMLHEVAAYGLVADGCAVLAEEVLQREGVLDGDSGRLRPLAVCVCLARLAEMIRAEGAKHASTGENQVDLTTLKEELKKLVALLRLDLAHVQPLLVRFCLTRGFWRLAHALVTGYFGGAIDQRDQSLAEVAVHPLTSSMADSIAEIAFQLDYLTVLPKPVLSRIERKGKFLQLILHSLTVDNTGNAGALSVLAACVMTTHFIIIWSKKDFKGLVQLMNQNEGLADRDNAAALSWLMQACNPAQFTIGKHRRQPGSPRGGEPEEGWQHQSYGDLTRLMQPDTPGLGRHQSTGAFSSAEVDEEESEATLVEGLIEEQAHGCLMWVLVVRFRERLRLALSGPIASDLGGSFRVRTPSWDWSTAAEQHEASAQPAEVVTSPGAASADGSGSGSPPLSPPRAAKKYLSGFARGAKAAAEKLMEKVDLSLPSNRFSMSPMSPANRTPSTPTAKDRPKPLPSQPVREKEVGHERSMLLRLSSTGISKNFFTDEGFTNAQSWQRTAPEQLGKRLMSALRGWRHRMKDSLMLDIYAFILNAGDLVEVQWCEEAARKELFEHKEHKRALWEFYSCQDYFRPLVDDAIKAQDGSTSTQQVRTLQEAVEHYTRRNALLRAMRYHKTFRGTLNVQLLRGQNLKVKDNFFNMLGGKDSRPTTYAILQYDGSVDPELYGSLVPKHQSELVKKDTSPHYNQIFTFDVVSARPNLRVQLMQKQTIGDDEPIGSADLDIARIQENQVASLDVVVERDGENVGEVKLRMIFKFEAKPVAKPVDEHSRHPVPSSPSREGGGDAPSSAHRRASLTALFASS